jgi:hypothetical protein
MRVGDLRQRFVGHADVVGGGIGIRVPGPQHPRQRLAGIVQPGEQGVKSIPMLVGGRTAFFLRMAGHQRGVEVDHQARHHRAGAPHRGDRPACFAAQQPRPFPGSSARDLQVIEERLVNRVEDPPRRRRRGHRPEQVRLVAEHRQVPDRDTAVGEHHRQISQHPARRMRRATLSTTADRGVECLTDTSRSGNIGEQPRPNMGADATPAGGNRDLRIRRDTLHQTGAFLVNRPLNSGKSRIGHRQGTSSFETTVSRPKINSLPQHPG